MNHVYVTEENIATLPDADLHYWYCLDCKHPCKSDWGCDCCHDDWEEVEEK